MFNELDHILYYTFLLLHLRPKPETVHQFGNHASQLAACIVIGSKSLPRDAITAT